MLLKFVQSMKTGNDLHFYQIGDQIEKKKNVPAKFWSP